MAIKRPPKLKHKRKTTPLFPRKRKACDSCVQAKVKCSGPDQPGGRCTLCIRKGPEVQCVFSLTRRKWKLKPAKADEEDKLPPLMKILEDRATTTNYKNGNPLLVSGGEAANQWDSMMKASKSTSTSCPMDLSEFGGQVDAPTSTCPAPVSEDEANYFSQLVSYTDRASSSQQPGCLDYEAGLLASVAPSAQPSFSPSSAVGAPGKALSHFLSVFLSCTETLWPTSNSTYFTPAMVKCVCDNWSYLNLPPSQEKEKARAEHISVLSACGIGAILEGQVETSFVLCCVDSCQKLLAQGDSMFSPGPEHARAFIHFALLCFMIDDRDLFEMNLQAAADIASVLNGPPDVLAMLQYCKDAQLCCNPALLMEIVHNTLMNTNYTQESLSQFNQPLQLYLQTQIRFGRHRLLFSNPTEEEATFFKTAYRIVKAVEREMTKRSPSPTLELYSLKLFKFQMKFLLGSHVAALSTSYTLLRYLETYPGMQFCLVKLGHCIHLVAMLFQKACDVDAYDKLNKALFNCLPPFGQLTPSFCGAHFCYVHGKIIESRDFMTDMDSGVTGGKLQLERDIIHPASDCDKYYKVTPKESANEKGVKDILVEIIKPEAHEAPMQMSM